jgi:monoamine oxidase
LQEKLKAAREMEFGNVVKVIFEFREPFWEDFGFIHALDEAIPTWWNDPRAPVLTGWTGGPQADALLGFSHSQLEEIGLGIIGKIFGVRPDLLRDQLVASHYWNWADDPHIRGAYSYIPVNGLNLPQVLAAPVAGTLFFAGEATVADAQMGTVFGALESGLRAAREIHGLD